MRWLSTFLLLILSLMLGTSCRNLARRAPIESRAPHEGEVVVLVHGLQFFRDTLKGTARHLMGQGYGVLTYNYETRREGDLVEAGVRLKEFIDAGTKDANKVHIVAHSMGCIVTRCALQHGRPKNLGSVVMMAAPNRGTESADWVAGNSLLRAVFGMRVPALATTQGSLVNSLPPVDYPTGVIMGNRPAHLAFLSPFLPGADDGIIPVERGRVEGMTDFVVVPADHTRLPKNPAALREIDSFLTTGRFRSDSGKAEAW